MKIRFSAPRDEIRSDLETVAHALKVLFGFGFGVVLLFFVFWWDARLDSPFAETGPTEIIQSLLLLASSALFFLEARRSPETRNALILAGGFLGCMLIREQDYYFDMIAHGCWKWPAFALAGVCLAQAARSPRQTLAALAKLIRWRYFPFLLSGVVIVLAYSRLFGMSALWNPLLPDGDWRPTKNAVEESSELLGYAFIFSSALLLRRGKA